MIQTEIDWTPPRDPRVTGIEATRLSAQSAAILARLRKGPASNIELADTALRYSARIHDLRALGYVIDIIERDRKTGRTVYELKEPE